MYRAGPPLVQQITSAEKSTLTFLQDGLVNLAIIRHVPRDSDERALPAGPDAPADGTPAANLDDKIDAFALVEPDRLLVPVLHLGVVDRLDDIGILVSSKRREEVPGPFELGRGGRGDDDARTGA